jgi:hypothetical protein
MLNFGVGELGPWSPPSLVHGTGLALNQTLDNGFDLVTRFGFEKGILKMQCLGG